MRNTVKNIIDEIISAMVPQFDDEVDFSAIDYDFV